MSHHHCHGGSCSSCSSSHHSHFSEQPASNHCACPCHKQGGCSCCCHQNEPSCSDHPHRLLALADEAWTEVLKEKIKERIRASDHKIDQMAEIICETNRAYWHHQLAKSKINEHYEMKLSQLFDEIDAPNVKNKKK